MEQAEKLTNNGNASPVGQESSAGADESGENVQGGSDKGMCYLYMCSVFICIYLLIFYNWNSILLCIGTGLVHCTVSSVLCRHVGDNKNLLGC